MKTLLVAALLAFALASAAPALAAKPGATTRLATVLRGRLRPLHQADAGAAASPSTTPAAPSTTRRPLHRRRHHLHRRHHHLHRRHHHLHHRLRTSWWI